MIMTIFYLLVAFQVKHLVCDYYLQGRYMLGKFNKVGWKLPLASHCGVHAIGTFTIAYFVVSPVMAIGIAALDFVTHFIIDKVKVESSRGITTDDSKFWENLGCDQTMHHLVHYLIIFILVFL